MAVSINQHQPGSFTVEMTADDDANVPSASWEQYFLLISDAHIDNAHADRAMFDRHMRQCRERGGRWFSNGDFLCLMQGKYDLSDATENLTLNAENALHSKFSDGTADTVEELAAAMQLKEWKEEDAGRKISQSWNRLVKQCVESKIRLNNDMNNPAGSDQEAVLGNQIKTLTEIIRWYERCYPAMVYEQPNFPPSDIEGEAPEAIKRELARMKRELGEMKKRERN